MSAATNWAWEQPVQPLAKLVLLALADVDQYGSDEQIDLAPAAGVLQEVADRVSMSPAEVQRQLTELDAAKLIDYDGRVAVLRLGKQ